MGSAQPVAPSGVAISGSAVTLTLASSVSSGDTVSLDYTPGTNPIRANGVDAAALSDQSVSTPALPPVLVGAEIVGDRLTLTYDRAPDTTVAAGRERLHREVRHVPW